jgi:hypothetical protein
LGRFHTVDPLAEKYLDFSPYVYVFNNPIYFIDSNGMEGEPYIKTHTTHQEQEFIIKNPLKGKKIYDNAQIAHTVTQRIFGPYENGNGHNDKADAFRHIFWQVLNTQDVGAYDTNKYANAHESETPKDRANEKEMDTHNNTLGIKIGIRMPDASMEEVLGVIYKAFQSGMVMVIDPKTGEVTISPPAEELKPQEKENTEQKQQKEQEKKEEDDDDKK